MAGYKTPPGTIVNTIKNLLKERYKQGFPIIKEIIQNAKFFLNCWYILSAVLVLRLTPMKL